MGNLMKCPFCGGEAKLIRGHGYSCYVRCVDCGCCTKELYGDEENTAINLWNTRKPMEAVVAKLENASYRTDSTFDEDGYCNDDSEEVVELHTAISIVRGKE